MLLNQVGQWSHLRCLVIGPSTAASPTRQPSVQAIHKTMLHTVGETVLVQEPLLEEDPCAIMMAVEIDNQYRKNDYRLKKIIKLN